jgi:predicted membrane channel-forming protein YqfA (hemolysin III family)
MPLSSKKEVTKYVHGKLLFRFRRLLFFLILIIAIVIDEVSHSYIAAYVAALGFILGIALGLLAAKRMHNISWDAETNKPVTRMDRLGIIILIAYLIFSISRRWIFSHWLQGYGLTVFSLSIGAGGMLGPLYTTRQKIRQVLKEEGVLRSKTSTK